MAIFRQASHSGSPGHLGKVSQPARRGVPCEAESKLRCAPAALLSQPIFLAKNMEFRVAARLASPRGACTTERPPFPSDPLASPPLDGAHSPSSRSVASSIHIKAKFLKIRFL